jgi:DNA-binding PadR family transcriptional regulator
MRDPVEREFLLAFWKIHILHHADEPDGVYGQWMLEELHRHGYRISPGTLYPILARMAVRGWLRATQPAHSKGARVYRLTPDGRRVLTRLRVALGELHGEAGRGTSVGLHRNERAPAPRRRKRVVVRSRSR